MRLVKRGRREGTAATRSSASACDETSITHVRSPASRIAAQRVLQLDALGRRALARQRPAAEALLDRAQQPRAAAGGIEHRVDQKGRGGLAVGAGDADHLELALGWP